ncbi:unnamed protein product, partial [Soboliphyme baturini]|uniref:MFS domain-containing protein n=1 Tax=Soboliphyme baturini TaxID=241478 RepID=A0A183IZH4_9BILA
AASRSKSVAANLGKSFTPGSNVQVTKIPEECLLLDLPVSSNIGDRIGTSVASSVIDSTAAADSRQLPLALEMNTRTVGDDLCEGMKAKVSCPISGEMVVTQRKSFYDPQGQSPLGTMQGIPLAHYRGYITVFPRYSARVFSAPALAHRKKRKKFSLKRIFEESFEFLTQELKLLQDIPFMLFVLSNFLLYTFYDIPYVNLPDYVNENVGDVDDDLASSLISVIGIVNTIAMLLYGFIADRKFFNSILWYGISVTMCGLAVLAIPWIHSNVALYAICGIFGFCIGANYTLTSVILVELMSISDFVYSYGLICLMQGFGTLIGPPFAGFIYDITGNYFLTFTIGGIGIVVSGTLVLLLSFLIWRHPLSND